MKDVLTVQTDEDPIRVAHVFVQPKDTIFVDASLNVRNGNNKIGRLIKLNDSRPRPGVWRVFIADIVPNVNRERIVKIRATPRTPQKESFIRRVGERYVIAESAWDFVVSLVTGRSRIDKIPNEKLSKKGKEVMTGLRELTRLADEEAREEGYENVKDMFEKKYGIK